MREDGQPPSMSHVVRAARRTHVTVVLLTLNFPFTAESGARAAARAEKLSNCGGKEKAPRPIGHAQHCGKWRSINTATAACGLAARRALPRMAQRFLGPPRRNEAAR